MAFPRILLFLWALGPPLSAQTLVDAPAVSAGASATTIHPLLVGSLSDAQSPLTLRLDLHASQLLSLNAAGPLLPEQAAGYLAPLREADAHPMDRLASGILARSLADPSASRRLMEAYPALESTAVRNIPNLLAQGDPYRGSPARSNAFLARLGREAAHDPEVARIFDGEDAKPSLELHEIHSDEGVLKTWKANARLIADSDDWTMHEHPAMPGAVIHSYGEKVEPWSPAWSYDTEKVNPMRAVADRDRQFRRLQEIGAGPRVLGRGFDAGAETWLDYVPDARARGRRWSYPVIVQERVYGEDIETLMIRRRFGPTEHALVDELIGRLAAAKLSLPGLQARDIVIGTTAADPRRRAMIVQKGFGKFELVPTHADRSRTREILLAQPVFAGIVNTADGPQEFTLPLSRLLEAGQARSQAASLWQRAKSGLRGLWSMSIFPEAK